jgi:hypothetical protein
MIATDSQDQWDEGMIRRNIELALLEIVDPNQKMVMERIVSNLIGLARRNEDLTDGMLQNLILRQVFGICDKNKIRQAPAVSKRIVDYLRRPGATSDRQS